MKLIFIDESGYSRNWKADIEDQPFHILSAVAIDADRYHTASEELRTSVEAIEDLELEHPLGQGFEIKAKEISRGKGWWKSHKDQRNELRELMLGFPETHGGAAIVVAIDKAKHRDTYAFPSDPDKLAFQYMFERIQGYLSTVNDYAVCIYDQTKILDDQMQDSSIKLIRDGSSVQYWSEYYGHVSKEFQIDRVLEFCFGKSDNSLGLQVSDFVAHFAYQYFKAGQPKKCGWWKTLESGIHTVNGNTDGYGLKVFPK